MRCELAAFVPPRAGADDAWESLTLPTPAAGRNVTSAASILAGRCHAHGTRLAIS